MAKPLTDAQRKLVEDNLPLAKFASRKLKNSFPSLDRDTRDSACLEGLCVAAGRHKPTLGKFSPLAIKCMRDCLREAKRYNAVLTPPIYSAGQVVSDGTREEARAAQGKGHRALHADLATYVPPEPFEEYQGATVDKMLYSLSERQAWAVEAIVIDGRSATDLAREAGMKRGTVNKYVARGLSALRKELAPCA